MPREDILAEIFLAEGPRRNFTPSLILPQFLAVLFDDQKTKSQLIFENDDTPPLIHPRQYFYPTVRKKMFFFSRLLTPTNVLAGKFELSSLTKFVTNAILLLVREWSNFAISLPPKHK